MSITPNQALMMVGPAIAWTFALVFLGMYLYSRTHRYLLHFASCYFLFGLGAASQILLVPADLGWNTMLSAVVYTASTLSLGQGLARRSGLTLGRRWHALAYAMITGPIYYYYYVQTSLITRIYILNFGIGLLLLAVAVKLSRLRRGEAIDRLVWWTLLLFAVHFFPRTFLTASVLDPVQAATFGQSTFWLTLQVVMTLSSVAFATVLLIAAPMHIIQTLKQDRDHDMLTGLLNRRGFDRRAKAQMGLGDDRPMTLVVCDLDHFKRVNDTYGHSTGDRVLEAFAELLRECLRQGDVVARIGGEEFVVLLPDCGASNALALVGRFRQRLKETQVPEVQSDPGVTASFGLSERLPSESLWDWFARTDMALYAAKFGGRNRIFVHDAVTGTQDHTPKVAPVRDSA